MSGPQTPVRLGLIGVGRWGRNYVSTIGKASGAILTAVASRNPATAEVVPGGCAIFSDWRALVADGAVDGVIVATPPASHAEIAIGALDAGKSVLVEKPLTQRLDDLAAIRQAMKRSGRLLMVDHTHLFHPAFRRLKAEARARGRIRGVRSSAGNLGPYRPDVPVLWDWGPHDIAMCLALGLSEIKPVAVTRRDVEVRDGARAERLGLSLSAAGGVPIDIRLSTLDSKHRWLAVDLDDATLIYRDRHPGGLTLHAHAGARPDDAGVPLDVPEGLPLTQVVVEFIDAIQRNATSDESFAIGEGVVECLVKCEAMMGRVG
jgi:predicted dehydrogenase